MASFAAMLDTHKWVAMASAAARARPAPVPTIAGGEGRGSEAPAPPYELMEFAPLAVLTNGLLGALNELRHCAPLALATPAARLLQVCLLSVVVEVKRRNSQAHLSCKHCFVFQLYETRRMLQPHAGAVHYALVAPCQLYTCTHDRIAQIMMQARTWLPGPCHLTWSVERC